MSDGARRSQVIGIGLVNLATLSGEGTVLTATAALTIEFPAAGWTPVSPGLGGTLRSPDGRVQVHFPPGAVNVPVPLGAKAMSLTRKALLPRRLALKTRW